MLIEKSSIPPTPSNLKGYEKELNWIEIPWQLFVYHYGHHQGPRLGVWRVFVFVLCNIVPDIIIIIIVAIRGETEAGFKAIDLGSPIAVRLSARRRTRHY